MIELITSITPDITSAQYLLSSISQCSSAILALILTIKLVMSQVGKYRLPLSYVAKFAMNEVGVLGVYLVTITLPLLILTFQAYKYSALAMFVFIISIFAIFYYTSLIIQKNAVMTFLEYCVQKRKHQFEDAIYDIALQAMSYHDINALKASTITMVCVPNKGLSWNAINNYVNRIAVKSLDNNEQFQTILDCIYIYTSPIARSFLFFKRSWIKALLFRVRMYYEASVNRPITAKVLKMNKFFREDSINSTHETYRILLRHRDPDMHQKVYLTFLNTFYDHFVASKMIKEGIETEWEPTISSIDLMIFEKWLECVPLDVITKFLKERNLFSSPSVIFYENWVPERAKVVMQSREKAYYNARGDAWNDFVDYIMKIRRRDDRMQKDFEILVYNTVTAKYEKSQVRI